MNRRTLLKSLLGAAVASCTRWLPMAAMPSPDSIDDLRGRIHNAFYTDLFLFLGDNDSGIREEPPREMTATELFHRQDEERLIRAMRAALDRLPKDGRRVFYQKPGLGITFEEWQQL